MKNVYALLPLFLGLLSCPTRVSAWVSAFEPLTAADEARLGPLDGKTVDLQGVPGTLYMQSGQRPVGKDFSLWFLKDSATGASFILLSKQVNPQTAPQPVVSHLGYKVATSLDALGFDCWDGNQFPGSEKLGDLEWPPLKPDDILLMVENPYPAPTKTYAPSSVKEPPPNPKTPRTVKLDSKARKLFLTDAPKKVLCPKIPAEL